MSIYVVFAKLAVGARIKRDLITQCNIFGYYCGDLSF